MTLTFRLFCCSAALAWSACEQATPPDVSLGPNAEAPISSSKPSVPAPLPGTAAAFDTEGAPAVAAETAVISDGGAAVVAEATLPSARETGASGRDAGLGWGRLPIGAERTRNGTTGHTCYALLDAAPAYKRSLCAPELCTAASHDTELRAFESADAQSTCAAIGPRGAGASADTFTLQMITTDAMLAATFEGDLAHQPVTLESLRRHALTGAYSFADTTTNFPPGVESHDSSLLSAALEVVSFENGVVTLRLEGALQMAGYEQVREPFVCDSDLSPLVGQCERLKCDQYQPGTTDGHLPARASLTATLNLPTRFCP